MYERSIIQKIACTTSQTYIYAVRLSYTSKISFVCMCVYAVTKEEISSGSVQFSIMSR